MDPANAHRLIMEIRSLNGQSETWMDAEDVPMAQVDYESQFPSPPEKHSLLEYAQVPLAEPDKVLPVFCSETHEGESLIDQINPLNRQPLPAASSQNTGDNGLQAEIRDDPQVLPENSTEVDLPLSPSSEGERFEDIVNFVNTFDWKAEATRPDEFTMLQMSPESKEVEEVSPLLEKCTKPLDHNKGTHHEAQNNGHYQRPVQHSVNTNQPCNRVQESNTANTGIKAFMVKIFKCLPRKDLVRMAKKVRQYLSLEKQCNSGQGSNLGRYYVMALVLEMIKCMPREDRIRMVKDIRDCCTSLRQVHPTMQQPGLPMSNPRDHQTHRQPSHAQVTRSQFTPMGWCGEVFKRKQMRDECSSSVCEAPTAFSLFRDQHWDKVQAQIKILNKTVINAVLQDRFSCLPQEEKVNYYHLAQEIRRTLEKKNVPF